MAAAAAACLMSFRVLACSYVALDSTSTHTDISTSGKKYHKLLNNAVLIRNERLFVVSAAAECIPLKHRGGVAGPPSLAKAGPLFSGSLDSFSDL